MGAKRIAREYDMSTGTRSWLTTPGWNFGLTTGGLTQGVFSEGVLRGAARGELTDALKHYLPVEVVSTLLRNAPPGKVGLVNASRYLDFKLTLAGDILVKIDRASMAVSLKMRLAYLHRDLLDLASRVPPRLLAGRNHSKGPGASIVHVAAKYASGEEAVYIRSDNGGDTWIPRETAMSGAQGAQASPLTSPYRPGSCTPWAVKPGGATVLSPPSILGARYLDRHVSVLCSDPVP
jgi:hypothetical protein